MSLFRKQQQDELELSQEEKDLLLEAEEAQGRGTGIGATVGSIAGGALGALSGLFTGGATTLPGASLGASLGGGVGGTIGSWLGGNQAKDALERANKLKQDRQSSLLDRSSKQEAIYGLLGDWIRTKGM